MTTVSYSDLVNNVVPKLSVPTFSGTESVLECGYAYVDCGWWLVPIRRSSKHPGSILGKGWPEKSSNQKSQLDIWFKGQSDRGIALHTGKSGAFVVDVDNPEELTQSMKKVLRETGAPYQSTRTNAVGRGHFVFAVPSGVRYTNSAGSLGTSWGEIRTGNSVIIAEPSVHVKAEEGGRYKWLTGGSVPLLPIEISSKLRTRASFGGDLEGVIALGDSALETFVSSLDEALAGELLRIRVEQALPNFRRGSRHNALILFLLYGFLDARAGLYPAVDMIHAGLEVFTRFKPLEEWTSPSEFWDLVKWTAAAARQMPDERVNQSRETGLALVQPGVKAWLKAVSNV
jgi:hypothetical protein